MADVIRSKERAVRLLQSDSHDDQEIGISLDVLPPPMNVGSAFDAENTDGLRNDTEKPTDNHRGPKSVDNLPPVDRGWGAWGFLLGVWLLEAMLWGFPLSFGIFQPHYSTHPLFARDAALIPSIGSIEIGLAYLLCVFTTPIAVRYIHHTRLFIFIGWCVCLLALLLASLATSAWHLLLTQGILYGIGWVICYTPVFLLLNQWFDTRRGLAYGILFGASGVSGLIIPFYLEFMLAHSGFRATLQLYVLATILISAPGFWLIKPRIPYSHPSSSHSQPPTNQINLSGPKPTFLQLPTTWLFFLATLLQGFAFFLPNIFLPSYTTSLALPPSSGSILLAATSLAQVTGQILLGHLSDQVSIYISSTLSALISGLAVLTLWGPATTLLQLPLSSLLWGFLCRVVQLLPITRSALKP